jgi:hypothetical protein
MSNPAEVTLQCSYCPHAEQGTPWWVGQQMPIHAYYAHPEQRTT